MQFTLVIIEHVNYSNNYYSFILPLFCIQQRGKKFLSGCYKSVSDIIVLATLL